MAVDSYRAVSCTSLCELLRLADGINPVDCVNIDPSTQAVRYFTASVPIPSHASMEVTGLIDKGSETSIDHCHYTNAVITTGMPIDAGVT